MYATFVVLGDGAVGNDFALAPYPPELLKDRALLAQVTAELAELGYTLTYTDEQLCPVQ